MDTVFPEHWICVDTETSEFDRKRGAILSIAAVNGIGKEFYIEVRPLDEHRLWSEKALQVNGFKRERCEACEVSFAEGYRAFMEWIPDQKCIWMGKNPSFDFEYMTNHAKLAWKEWGVLPKDRFSRRLLDVHQWAYAYAIKKQLDIRHEDFNTDMVYGHLGFDKEPLPHNALTGAKLAMEKFKKLAEEL